MALDKEIEEKAIAKAEDTVAIVRTARERKLEERHRRMDDIVDEMAKMIIKENEAYLGREVAGEAIIELTKGRKNRNEKEEKAAEKEEKANEKKQKEIKTTTRRRKAKTA